MSELKTQTLAEIIERNHSAIRILEKYAIDYCINGNQTLDEACLEKNISINCIIHDLSDGYNTSSQSEFSRMSLTMLIDYIRTKHHLYVEQQTPILKKHILELEEKFASQHPELRLIKNLFFEISGELIVHMKKEEFILFPFIKKLEKAKGSDQTVSSPLFAWISNPVNMMMDDHAAEFNKYKKISTLTNHYKAHDPEEQLLSKTYRLLEQYEKDLHMHIHLENNILFPKAIMLEKEVNVAGPF